jgi:hypothetical protein
MAQVNDGFGSPCFFGRLHEDDADFLAFHVEHIIAKKHGGKDDPNSLCYACSECNWAKGPNLTGLLAGKLYALFNPRQQHWTRHFRWDHTILVGKTKTGIVTVQVLNINDAARVMLRENLLFEGRFPPEE